MKMGISEGGNLLIKVSNISQDIQKEVGNVSQITAIFIVSQEWWSVTTAVYEVMSWIVLVNQYFLMLTKVMVAILKLYFKWKTLYGKG